MNLVPRRAKKKIKSILIREALKGAISNTKIHGFLFAKPLFPSFATEKVEDISLFAGEASINFFKILNLGMDFLSLEVSDWSSSNSYLASKKIVKNFRVVNDTAGRGVKLCCDFLGAAKTEHKMQKTLQVVENSRSRIPNQRNHKVVSTRWFWNFD